jgi:hypothetical protein
MPVPAEVLSVKRPVNTRVKQCGKRYNVIARTCVYDNGRNVPLELWKVGEIVGNRYIETRAMPTDEEIAAFITKKKQPVANSQADPPNDDSIESVDEKAAKLIIDVKEYGDFFIFNQEGQGVLDDLIAAYGEDTKTAKRLYMIALLRAINGDDLKDRDLQMAYLTSFASENYPGIALSENTVSDFLEKTGMAYRYIRAFMQNRIKNCCGDHILVDGMLKDNTSTTNSYSAFSRKARLKGTEDNCLFYAYSLEKREPVAVKLFSGNSPDMTNVKQFSQENNITNGIIVGDKGMYTAGFVNFLNEKENITYILPLKNSSSWIQKYNMLNGVDSLLREYLDHNVLFKKVKVDDNHFLYAFRDVSMSHEQESGYIHRVRDKAEYDANKYNEEKEYWGLIVFLCNSDLHPLIVYLAYIERWNIEVMFNFYKNILCLENVSVQGDYRLIATEFINFLSVLIGCRVKKKFESTELKKVKGKSVTIAETYPFGVTVSMLSKIKMVRTSDLTSWEMNHVLSQICAVYNALTAKKKANLGKETKEKMEEK